MSLDYYLYCRRKYENILQHMQCIIDTYEDIHNATINEDRLERDQVNLFNTEYKLQFFNQKKAHIAFLKEECNKKIWQLCKHDFVTDVIDIDPERSQTIHYCRFCECDADTK